MAGTKCTDVDGYWCVNNGSLQCKPQPDGWLVWFRRLDGSVLFDNNWQDYERGFGEPDGNYWLGLRTLHLLTGTGTWHKLRVDFGAWTGETSWAEYRNFSIGAPETNYQLNVRVWFGNTTNDLFYYGNNVPFSTWDNSFGEVNCANDIGGGGGWWYYTAGCISGEMPTGVYSTETDRYSPYMSWDRAFNTFNPPVLKSIRVSVRPL